MAKAKGELCLFLAALIWGSAFDFRVFQVYGGSAGAAACNIYL